MKNLDKDEKILLKKHRHWLVLVGELIGLTFVVFIPFVVFGIYSGTELNIGAYTVVVSLDTAMATLLSSVWLLFFWMIGFGVWTNFYLDMWTVTNKRIIDNEQKRFFHRQTSVMRMEKIQDVTVEINGIIPTLLNFGDIHVQSAGEMREFIMHGISDPRHVREIILDAQNKVFAKRQDQFSSH